MPLTLVTWNLKGSKGVDVDAVADHLRDMDADLVALQEVQHRQARALGRRLDAASVGWGFKHWPVRTAPEGMAVIGVTRRAAVRTHALSFPFRLWSWRRRIFQTARVEAGGDAPFLLVNAHLSPKAQAERRAREVTAVLRAGAAAPGSWALAGDFNDRPGAALFDQLADAGLRDAWTAVHPNATEADSATNWHGWTPGTDKAPGRRLDYVLVSAGVRVSSARVPRFGEEGFARFARLSDHLPVTVTLEP